MTAPLTFVIPGDPTVLRAAAVEISAVVARGDQHHPGFAHPVTVAMHFEFPIPDGWGGERRARAVRGEVAPALSLPAVIASALLGIRESNVVSRATIAEVHARKVFGLQPKTVVTIAPSCAMDRAQLAAAVQEIATLAARSSPS